MRDGDRPRHTNGHRPRGMHARHHLRAAEEPIDLAAVQADDELISALAAGMTVSAPGYGGYDADDRVAAILASWREQVDAEPLPELVDIDTAVATIKRARRPASRARHLAPVAAAAAFAVLLAGGLSVTSASAEPGDALWGVSKVLFSERAGSIEAAVRVEDRITNAKHALTQGQPVVAAQELAKAQDDLPAVRPEEGKVALSEVQDFLVAKADETPPGRPTDPGTPLESDRQRPVPAGAAVGEDPSTGQPEQDPAAGPTTAPNPDPGTGTQPVPSADPSASTSPSPTVTPSVTAGPSTTATAEGGPASGTAAPAGDNAGARPS
ncbi:MAG: hypothetical protein L0H84_21500 [Pseudonocardia sp.]|nr:hypothetical protein [Pseudonocardia sp.]